MNHVERDVNQAIVHLCKALARLLRASTAEFDRETSDLMRSLAAFVEKNG